LGEWLVLVLAAITAYVAWQIAPLTARMDALERDRLATKDDLLAALEGFGQQLSALQGKGSSPAASQAPPPSETPPPRPAPPSSPPPAATSPPGADLEYFDRHLLPSDAKIARMMVGKAPTPDIARATGHSAVYVLARGRQIEEMLAAAHDAPPDLLRAIREYLKRERP
jgi:hypothetical protein